MIYEEFLKSLSSEEKDIATFYEQVSMACGETVMGPCNALEIGSGWGLFSRVAMEFMGRDSKLLTIDKNEPTSEFKTRTQGMDGITFVQEDSVVFLPQLVAKGFQYDLILIDGSHVYREVREDIKNAWAMLKVGGVLLIDDALHRKNWEHVGATQEIEYGVMQALAEFLKERQGMIASCEVHNYGHGIVEIIKQ